MKLPRPHPRLSDLAPALVAVALVAALAACGGCGQVSPAHSKPAAHGTVEPLFDDRGNPIIGTTSNAEPADPLARSRLGRYATRDQYEWELLNNRDRTVLIDLDDAGADAAVGVALNIGHWYAMPSEVNFFVRSRDARAAASLANTLAEFGYLRVFVIV